MLTRCSCWAWRRTRPATPCEPPDFLDRSEAMLRKQGRLGLLPYVRGMQGPVYLEFGDWDRVGEAAEECRRFANETGQPIWDNAQIVNAGACPPSAPHSATPPPAASGSQIAVQHDLCAAQVVFDAITKDADENHA